MNNYEPEIFAFVRKERERIHQDAHDKVYNRLAALAKRTENLAYEPTLQKHKLEEISESIRQAISDLQDIIGGNHSDSLMALTPSEEKIRQACQEHVINYGQQIAFTCQSDCYGLLGQKEFWHLHCILQECLNNAGKHSKATRVNIDLKKNNRVLIMQISDNGQGLPNDACQSGGRGLKGIKERVAILGGKVCFKASRQGTTITVKVPLKKQKAN